MNTQEKQPLQWQVGNPDVAEGKRESFWCAVQTDPGKTRCIVLEYLNRYAMPASDYYDPPSDAEPVPGEEDEYYWTGWQQESCDTCNTIWDYDGKVVAWMRLPVYSDPQNPNQP